MDNDDDPRSNYLTKHDFNYGQFLFQETDKMIAWSNACSGSDESYLKYMIESTACNPFDERQLTTTSSNHIGIPSNWFFDERNGTIIKRYLRVTAPILSDSAIGHGWFPKHFFHVPQNGNDIVYFDVCYVLPTMTNISGS